MAIQFDLETESLVSDRHTMTCPKRIREELDLVSGDSVEYVLTTPDGENSHIATTISRTTHQVRVPIEVRETLDISAGDVLHVEWRNTDRDVEKGHPKVIEVTPSS